MASHPGSGHLVLFGGSNELGTELPDRDFHVDGRSENSLDDTWTWDGKAWVLQTSPGTPKGRLSAAMAEGPGGTLGLFSGINEDDTYPTDTWVYERKMTVRLESAVLPADGTSTSRAVATVLDGSGRGSRGATVSFSTNGDARFSATTDHGDGTYSATVTAGNEAATAGPDDRDAL